MRFESDEQVNTSIPVLKKVVEMTKDDTYMEDVYRAAKCALKNAERCKRFGIYSTNNGLEYGCGIYLMHNIPNDKTYDEAHPEELLKISFPTGAYIFGERYDTEYFDEFYDELLEIKPDYHDRLNRALYYKPQNAKRAWEHYRETYQKYMRNNRERVKVWELNEAKKEYEALLKDVSIKEVIQNDGRKETVDSSTPICR